MAQSLVVAQGSAVSAVDAARFVEPEETINLFTSESALYRPSDALRQVATRGDSLQLDPPENEPTVQSKV